MNKANQLLELLDRVFGFPNKIRSTFKKTNQGFDERTGEHVFIIEYRIKRKGTYKSTPSKDQKRRQLALHRLVANQAKQV